MPTSPHRTLLCPGLSLEAALAPWDAVPCGFPVGQILAVHPLPPESTPSDWQALHRWIQDEQLGLVSCRLPHQQLAESLLLESAGFRSIEWVTQPSLDLDRIVTQPDPDIELVPAVPAHLPILADIAGSAFATDRFSVDPRLPRAAAGIRYRRWVESTPTHPVQRMLSILIEGTVAGFFITETGPESSIYWHLTALSPELHGRGWGKRTWLHVLARHQEQGLRTVRTTISLRNTPVVNLYARLGFRFSPPSMTLHLVP